MPSLRKPSTSGSGPSPSTSGPSAILSSPSAPRKTQGSISTTATAVSSSSTTSTPTLPTIIIDSGAHELKIGFAHPSSISKSHLNAHVSAPSSLVPRIQISPNLLARSPSSKTPFIGSSLLTDCQDFGSLSLRVPMERGLVTDWAAQKIIWDHALVRALASPEAMNPNLTSRREEPSAMEANPKSNRNQERKKEGRLLSGRDVILTETYFNLPELETAFDTMLFEEYGAESLWRVTPAQLVPYAPIFRPPTLVTDPTTISQQDARGPSTTQALHPSPPSSSTKRKAVTARGSTSSSNNKANDRPQTMLIVDVGHSSVNVVPMHEDEAIWRAAKRLDISGRLLTNLLKETISFRQWDMMDEAWLMGKVKEACCFVAAESGSRVLSFVGGKGKEGGGGDGHGHGHGGGKGKGRDGFLKDCKRPKEASFVELVEVMRRAASPRRNPLTQEYVLPDYRDGTSSSSLSKGRDNAHKGKGKDEDEDEGEHGRRFGYVRSGAGSASSLRLVEERRGEGRREGEGELDEEDAFVADLEKWEALLGLGEGDEEDDEEEEEDSEDEFLDQVEGRAFKRRKAPKAKNKGKGDKRSKEGEDEAQLLSLGPERFQIPESLFCPGLIGLQQAPLHEVIARCIDCCDEEWRETLWSNIVVVGGGARMRGLKRRLENELRALAPEDVPLSILVPERPELAAVRGGMSLASSPSNSARGKLLSSRRVTRAEWGKGGTEVCRTRFGTWSGVAGRWVIEEEERRRREEEEERREEERESGSGSGEEESSEEESESEESE